MGYEINVLEAIYIVNDVGLLKLYLCIVFKSVLLSFTSMNNIKHYHFNQDLGAVSSVLADTDTLYNNKRRQLYGCRQS